MKSCEMIAPLNQKNRSRCYARCLSCLVFCGLLIAAGHGEAQQENWAVPSAALRVDVSVSRDPDHPDLGVFVKIPNGGLLPGKFRVPEVRDAQGKPLESVIVADSQTDGFGVLFAQPDDGKNATVYHPLGHLPQRPTNTRLFPSTIFSKTAMPICRWPGAWSAIIRQPKAPPLTYGITESVRWLILRPRRRLFNLDCRRVCA